MSRESKTTSLGALIVEVRRAFQALRAAAEELHGDLGVTAAMRAVMEHLADGTPRTVPQIARDKNVTRQHIQQIVNALLEARMIQVSANPRHQASPLMALTPLGKGTFAEIRKREAAALSKVAKRLHNPDLENAAATLKDLTAQLEKGAT
jgi:DNA-binding MarR family transcriptional regulator